MGKRSSAPNDSANWRFDNPLSTQSILQLGDGSDGEGQKGDTPTARPVTQKCTRALDHDAGLARARARRDESRARVIDHALLFSGRFERRSDHFTSASIAAFR